MMRKAMRPHTLSDNTYLPAGQWVVAPAWAFNRSPHIYANPNDFDAFRFARLREECGQTINHQLATPASGYLSFGAGRHAW